MKTLTSKTNETVTFTKTGRTYTMTNSLGEKLEGLKVADVRSRIANLHKVGWRIA
jgi:hypothetical protein